MSNHRRRQRRTPAGHRWTTLHRSGIPQPWQSTSLVGFGTKRPPALSNRTVVTAYLLGPILAHALTASFLHYRGDPQSGRRGVLVLPDANDLPAIGSELLISVLVAVLVLSYLRAPETRVELRGAQVIGAAVPEAAVKEDGDLSSCEDEIRSTAKSRDGTSVDTVTEPQGVNG